MLSKYLLEKFLANAWEGGGGGWALLISTDTLLV